MKILILSAWLFAITYSIFHFRRPLTECWWSVRNWFRIHVPPQARGFADFWIGVWKVEQQDNPFKYDYDIRYDWDYGYQWGMASIACLGVCLAVAFLVTIIFFSI